MGTTITSGGAGSLSGSGNSNFKDSPLRICAIFCAFSLVGMVKRAATAAVSLWFMSQIRAAVFVVSFLIENAPSKVCKLPMVSITRLVGSSDDSPCLAVMIMAVV